MPSSLRIPRNPPFLAWRIKETRKASTPKPVWTIKFPGVYKYASMSQTKETVPLNSCSCFPELPFKKNASEPLLIRFETKRTMAHCKNASFFVQYPNATSCPVTTVANRLMKRISTRSSFVRFWMAEVSRSNWFLCPTVRPFDDAADPPGPSTPFRFRPLKCFRRSMGRELYFRSAVGNASKSSAEVWWDWNWFERWDLDRVTSGSWNSDEMDVWYLVFVFDDRLFLTILLRISCRLDFFRRTSVGATVEDAVADPLSFFASLARLSRLGLLILDGSTMVRREGKPTKTNVNLWVRRNRIKQRGRIGRVSFCFLFQNWIITVWNWQLDDKRGGFFPLHSCSVIYRVIYSVCNRVFIH